MCVGRGPHPARPTLSVFDAIVSPGLEAVLAAELTALGLTPEPTPGAVRFQGSDTDLVRALLACRSTTRIVEVIAEAPCRTFSELERFAKRVDLGRFVTPKEPIRFVITAHKSRLFHTGAIAERLGRDLKRTVDPKAEITVLVRVHHDRVRLSVDAAGDRLNLRGYRLETAHAPLRETLAAGILLGLEYAGTAPLVDPMCGSGTFPIEAAWIATQRAPSRDRPLACERWPGLSADLAALREAARTAERPLVTLITGSDRDPRAVEAARHNGERAGVEVAWHCADVRHIGPGDLPPGLLIANLPYGQRISAPEVALRAFDQAAERFVGWTVAALWGAPGPVPSGYREAMRLSNGGIPIRVIRRD